MARNVRHDHRVTLERERAVEALGKQPRTPDALEAALDAYFKERVRTRDLPDYVYHRLNSVNIVVEGRGRPTLIDRHVALARVLDLNGLGRVFQWAWNEGFPPVGLNEFPGDDAVVSKWLDRCLIAASDGDTERVVRSILSILRDYAQKNPFQPCWVTTWNDFEPHLSDRSDKARADRWLEVLGIRAWVAGRWILPLKYTIRDAGTLARPTQLDAGWYAYHFPSPPQAAPSVGGHTMDLAGTPSANLRREFIHKQIAHPVEHWIATGRVIARTTRTGGGCLAKQRQAHVERLASLYGHEVLAWMPSPM